ncbi:MAG: hypothetical protein KAR42_04105 [candidate division Zixibacteria bacterium]|nr:hypothetical protein [candidate division Zixibacteria bacterium]
MKSLYRLLSDHHIIIALSIYASIAIVYAITTNGVMRDDAYIFFQYARNWAQTGIPSFNPGEVSFGFTSFAWTALLALGSFILPNVVILAKTYGIIFASAGAVLWAKWIFDRVGLKFDISAIALSALLPTIGAGRMVMGMENSLICFLSGLLLILFSSRLKGKQWLAGLVGGLLLLTRPDMLIFPAGLTAFLIYKKKFTQAVRFVLISAAIYIWWPLWLFLQTGSFIPGTRVGKLSVFLPEHLNITVAQFQIGTILERISWGLIAFKSFLLAATSSKLFIALLSTAIIVFLYTFIKKRLSNPLITAIAPAVVIILLIVYGYFFPLLKLRYFVWLTPALFFGIFCSIKSIMPPPLFRYGKYAALVLLLVLLIPGVKRQQSSTDIQQIRREVAEELVRITPINARIALEPIGEIGYYSNRHIVDMGGLIEESIRPYIVNGYKDTSLILKCLQDYQADYLVTYDNDKYLGRMPVAYPEIFEAVSFIPKPENSQPRYQILKINFKQ